MRSLLIVALVIGSTSSLSLFDRLQGYASKQNATTRAPGTENQQPSFLGYLQNTSFGNFVSNGVDAYNQAKDEKKNRTENGGVVVDASNFFGNLANSSFGQSVQNGYNNFVNNGVNNGAAAPGSNNLLTRFVPFLANASTEAVNDFYTILPKVENMTIAEFEEAVNTWAAKYGYTDEVNKFNENTKNVSKNAEDEATRIVSSLPTVLENLKSIGNNKNQTFGQMYNASFTYIMSLDEQTRQIVMVLFQDLIPPQLRGAGCYAGSGILSSATIQQASDFLSGLGANASAGLSGIGEFFNNAGTIFGGSPATNGSAATFGESPFFNQIQSFFGQSANAGNGNGNQHGPRHGPNTPLEANFPIFRSFLQNNNVSESDFAANVQNQILTGGANVGTVGTSDVQNDEGGLSLQVLPAVAGVQHNVPHPKQHQKNQNKNRKKATTEAPEASADVL